MPGDLMCGTCGRWQRQHVDGVLCWRPGPPAHEVLTDVHRLVDERDAIRMERDFAQAVARQYFSTLTTVAGERDALRRQVEELASQRTEANLRADQWEVGAESLRAQLAKAKAQATEAEATVDRMRWEASGAPMSGETRNLTPEEQVDYNTDLATLTRPVR